MLMYQGGVSFSDTCTGNWDYPSPPPLVLVLDEEQPQQKLPVNLERPHVPKATDNCASMLPLDMRNNRGIKDYDKSDEEPNMDLSTDQKTESDQNPKEDSHQDEDRQSEQNEKVDLPSEHDTKTDYDNDQKVDSQVESKYEMDYNEQKLDCAASLENLKNGMQKIKQYTSVYIYKMLKIQSICLQQETKTITYFCNFQTSW